jgi:hypothetical protein
MTGSKTDAAKARKVSPGLLVLLGIVAVGGVIYLITTLGGGTSTQTLPPVPTPSASPTATGGGSTPAASPSPEASPTKAPETFEVFESKDPFRPLVVVAAETPAGGEGGGGATPAPGPAASPGPGAGGAPAPSGGTVIELLDIIDAAEAGGTAKAQVKIGSTVYTVPPGETFASTFKVLSISGTCATMLNGDDKFTVCKGEQIVK